MSAAIKWDDFSPMLAAMDAKTQVNAAQQLGLEEWLPALSPAAVVDVLRAAPLPVVQHFLPQLSAKAAARILRREGRTADRLAHSAL